MAKVIVLEGGVAVAPQLVASDFAELAQQGFRSVVNNRPDGEAPGQLSNSEAEAAARSNGLEFRHQPVSNPAVTDETNVATFARLLEEMPRPVLFYCRSGTRCTTLWAQASAKRLGVERTIEMAAAAGYDIRGLRDLLAERANDEAEASDAGRG